MDGVQKRAFDELKDRLCRASCLSTPDVNKPWFLQCDASGVGVGACIGQYDSGGPERPVAYASQNRTPTQRAWSTIEREASAAIWALKRIFLGYLVVGSPLYLTTIC